MKIAFALAGLHRIHRGAEVAFISVASELAKTGHDVTLFGSGQAWPGTAYRFVHVPAIDRKRFESFPQLPTVRNESSWEDATFAPALLATYKPSEFDISVTCAFPFTHWALRRPVLSGKRPRHVFVTQNGDWPAYSDKAEFRFFSCDGLVCINPDYLERNRDQYRCALIPNGVDLNAFKPAQGERARFGMPDRGPIILMVSALIESKDVAKGIEVMAEIPGATLVVAGDGPLRKNLAELAASLLPDRYIQLTVPSSDMPALYRSADVFMHLSRDESFGNVFLEAMATGLPIVAHDSPRTRWIVGDDAFLLQSGKVQEIAAAVRSALAGGGSSQEVNRNRALIFGWQAIAGQYADFFSELCDGTEQV